MSNSQFLVSFYVSCFYFCIIWYFVNITSIAVFTSYTVEFEWATVLIQIYTFSTDGWNGKIFLAVLELNLFIYPFSLNIFSMSFHLNILFFSHVCLSEHIYFRPYYLSEHIFQYFSFYLNIFFNFLFIWTYSSVLSFYLNILLFNPYCLSEHILQYLSFYLSSFFNIFLYEHILQLSFYLNIFLKPFMILN